MDRRTIRAAVVRVPSGPDSIEIVDALVREPGSGEVCVKVAAAPVNPVDVVVAEGIFHAMGLINQPKWTGLGSDFAGTVVATGEGVDVAVGTRVAGLLAGHDRDFGAHAEEVVVRSADIAVVPAGLDLVKASTVPLNGLTAGLIVDQLGDAPGEGNRLLVTGAAGAVGGYVVSLAAERGWRVTGLARAHDEQFVRDLGAEFTTDARPGWDAVADAAAMQDQALALVRDDGLFVAVRPGIEPASERGIAVRVVRTYPDRTRLADLLAHTASGALPARVRAVVPLDRAAEAHRALAGGGVRGRYVLQP